MSLPLQAQDHWADADRQTRRLSPAVFDELPTPVRFDLERRGCTVPQLWGDTLARNVVSGRFRHASTTDWAVLCSVDRTSTILVYWEGRADSVAEIASAPDRAFLRGVGNGRIGFSRAISGADGHFIRRQFERYGGREPPPLDHDGINDAFIEKASLVWYWYNGEWLRLTGTD